MIDALALLGASSADQLAWIDKYQVTTDEVALEFDDALHLLSGVWPGHGESSEDVMSRLRLVDAVLGEMSGVENAERWSREALSADAGWCRVRALARDLLVDLRGSWCLPLPEILVLR
jgi:hypothetical protein